MENQVLASTLLQDTARTTHKTSAVTRPGLPRKPTDLTNEGAPSAGAVLAVSWRGRCSPGVPGGTGARSSARADP